MGRYLGIKVLTEDEYHELVASEDNGGCSWYYDDCDYCGNCHFHWMDYEWDEKTQKFVKEG